MALATTSTAAQDTEQFVEPSNPSQEQTPSTGTSPVSASLFSGELALQAHELRGLTAEVATLVLRSDIGGPISFEVFATPLRGNETHSTVPIFVEIDGPALLESNQSGIARIEVYAYALGAGQKVGGYLAEAFAVNTLEIGEAVWQSGIKYYGSLDLPPGDFKLRVLVRNYHSKASGLREASIQVPAEPVFETSFLSPALFSPPSGRDAWIPAIRDLAKRSTSYPFFDQEGRALSPAVRPVLAVGRQFQAHLLGIGLPKEDIEGRIQWRLNGNLVDSSSFSLKATTAGLDTLAKARPFRFSVPEMQPGVYEVRVSLPSVDGSILLSPPTTVAVVRQPAGDRSLQWTDLRGQQSSATKVAETTRKTTEEVKTGRRARNKEEKRHVGELAAGYRRALALLGSKDQKAARSAILDLEAEVLTDGSIESLRAAELQVAGELANTEVESLIPVLVLHDEIYLTYRRRRIYSLSSNARLLIERLAELYAEKGGTEGSRIVAGRALASLGGRLQRANLPASSRRLYERALFHDPKNEAAALGLATSFERHANYREAIDVLEHLVAAHPTYGEGLLRLAVNLRRIGVLARTKDLLSRVTELDAPDWVRAVASQELARSLMVAGDIKGATELLEASVEELPNQQASRFILAHLYDRQRLPMRALEILRTETPKAEGDSARKIYDGWPREPLENVRGELARAAALRVPLVSKILGAASSLEGQ